MQWIGVLKSEVDCQERKFLKYHWMRFVRQLLILLDINYLILGRVMRWQYLKIELRFIIQVHFRLEFHQRNLLKEMKDQSEEIH